MEIPFWTIRLLNALFTSLLGLLSLRLLSWALQCGRENERPGGPGAEPPVLNILRDRAPFLRVLLEKDRYRVGRDSECDIVLKGPGIPLVAGEISARTSGCFFSRDRQECLFPSGGIAILNYLLTVESFRKPS